MGQNQISNYLAATPEDVITWFSGFRMRAFVTQGFFTQIDDIWAGHTGTLDPLATGILPIALLVKLTSRGPVFFRQRRASLNGKPFNMIKFRTMVRDAEEKKAELLEQNELILGSSWPRPAPAPKSLRARAGCSLASTNSDHDRGDPLPTPERSNRADCIERWSARAREPTLGERHADYQEGD